MTAISRPGAAAGSVPADGLEVCTTSSDTLRAAIVVEGSLSERTSPLLLSVLGTHIRAGRRYLRVDLARTSIQSVCVLTALVDAHACLAEIGGMLVFDNADERIGSAMRERDLLVSPPD